MIDKVILAKIRKCLALGKSSNEHEAAAALAKARALMDEHGLDEGMLDLVEIEESTARASRTKRPPQWQTILSATVSHALEVVAFVDQRGDITFVGRGPRSWVACYAFAVLFRQLKAARRDYIASQLRRCKPGRKRARADVFCEGWAAAVYRKIKELLPPPPEDLAVGQYLQVQHPGLVTVNSREASAKRAEHDWWRGNVQGRKVELNVGVGAEAQPLALA